MKKFAKLLFYPILSILVIGLLTGITVIVGIKHLKSKRLKVFEQLEALNRGAIAFTSAYVEDYFAYPTLQVSVSDLKIRDTNFDQPGENLIEIDHAIVSFSVDIWSDTLAILHYIAIDGGAICIVADSTGNTNLSSILKTRENTAHQPSKLKRFTVDENVQVQVDSLAVTFDNPGKENKVHGYIQNLCVDRLPAKNSLQATADLEMTMQALEFKKAHGSFLQDSKVKGKINLTIENNRLFAESQQLLLAENKFGLSSVFHLDKQDTSHIKLTLPETVLAKALPILTDDLRNKLSPYQVEGTFSTTTHISSTFQPGAIPEVKINLSLPGNKASVNNLDFNNTYLQATFYNRPIIPVYKTPLGTKGVHLDIDSISTVLEGFSTTSSNARINSVQGKSPTISGLVHLHGPARALTEVIKSDQFSFRKGTVNITTQVEGPLNNLTEMITRSGARILIEDVFVDLLTAQVTLPLKRIFVNKIDSTAQIELTGIAPSTKDEYYLTGQLKGIESLIRENSAIDVISTVNLQSSRFGWTDLINILGEKEPDSTATQPDTTAIDDQAKAYAIKQALAVIESTFKPTIQIKIDTVDYYDFQFYNLISGLYFPSEKRMILEKSSFSIDTSLVKFRGEIDISASAKTDFDFAVKASHLDLSYLLPKANYFGVKFLKDIGTLPNDINIDLTQRGWIDDVKGLLPNQSSGEMRLVSNKDRAFDATIEFEPDRPEIPGFESTRVRLQGSPALFNGFFATEKFFFKGGQFDFTMGYGGLIPDLATLLGEERMCLDLYKSTVHISSIDIDVPVTSLGAAMYKDAAEVNLFLKSEELGQEIHVDGTADGVSQLVLGNTGKQFSTDLLVSSPKLVWKDLNALIGTISDATTDKKPKDISLREVIRELMISFEPTITLDINELDLTNNFKIRNVASGLSMDSKHVLKIDTTGFDYLDGSIQLFGQIDLDDLAYTPFETSLTSDSLNLASILKGAEYFNVPALANTRLLEGKLTMQLDAKGALAGDSAYIVPAATEGNFSFELIDLAVKGLAPLDSIAQKYNISDRLEHLMIAPITNTLILKGTNISVPLMELRSNAFNVFLAGDFDLNGPPNFWVSVPLANLKKRDLSKIPPPESFAERRFKIHLEFSENDKQEQQVKLHFSRRKFFDTRGGKASYKAAKKEIRKERRELRRTL